MEACSGSHHIGRQLAEIGHDVRLIPAQYVKPFLKGHNKNDYRDAEGIADAVQLPTMHFVTIKTPEQMDLLALHRVRSRLVGRRTGVINQIRGFLIERGITVRQGPMPLPGGFRRSARTSVRPIDVLNALSGFCSSAAAQSRPALISR
jgi:transposase